MLGILVLEFSFAAQLLRSLTKLQAEHFEKIYRKAAKGTTEHTDEQE